MNELLEKYDLENMINVAVDRFNAFEGCCDAEESDPSYRKGLLDIVELLETLDQMKK